VLLDPLAQLVQQVLGLLVQLGHKDYKDYRVKLAQLVQQVLELLAQLDRKVCKV
jgi:hypothetical protein